MYYDTNMMKRGEKPIRWEVDANKTLEKCWLLLDDLIVRCATDPKCGKDYQKKLVELAEGLQTAAWDEHIVDVLIDECKK